MTTLDTLQMLREELQTGYGHTACAVRNELTGDFVPTRQVKLWTEWSRQIRHDKQFNAVCVCVCVFYYLAVLEGSVSYCRWTRGQSYPVSLLLHQRTQEGVLHKHEAKHTSTVRATNKIM